MRRAVLRGLRHRTSAAAGIENPDAEDYFLLHAFAQHAATAARQDRIPGQPMTTTASPRRSWPDYSAVWRWHFYAGLLCVPFIIWLSITGSIYLFKPQIESWLDAPYDHLALAGHRASADAQVQAALAAMPGSTLRAYVLPARPQDATRILIGKGDDVFRVYLNPETRKVLKTVNEGARFMNQISFLHGQLAIGDRGSMIVEIAACWAIVMILTGLFLWWPRGTTGPGGVLFPRLNSGARLFWRDLHAVTGLWVSALALGLLLTGLPWAKNWGDYLREVRVITGTTEGVQDWTNGQPSRTDTAVVNHADHMHAAAPPVGGGSGMAPAMGMDHRAMAPARPTVTLAALVSTAATLDLAAPVLLTPPSHDGGPWTVKSDAANRPLRATVELDGATGAILGRRNFNQRHLIDQAIGIGIAAHEGALFGWINQLISAGAALGLVMVSASAIVLWVRRRPGGALGAPEQMVRPRFAPALLGIIVVLAVLFPLFGVSLVTVAIAERIVLRPFAPVRAWLGLTSAADE